MDYDGPQNPSYVPLGLETSISYRFDGSTQRLIITRRMRVAKKWIMVERRTIVLSRYPVLWNRLTGVGVYTSLADVWADLS